MARARRTVTLDEKIEKVQQAVFQVKDKYNAAVEEQNKLHKKKQELLKAVEASGRSYDEIMQFLSGKSDPDEE